MNRIEERFTTLKAAGKTAFIPYITGGDPTLAMSKEIILALEAAGADIIELGVPFSDPVGDGPVIQQASQRALLNHVTTRDILALVKEVRQVSQVPVLLFSYFNPILVYGIERLAKDMAEAGADGLLCVDLPAEAFEVELSNADGCARRAWPLHRVPHRTDDQQCATGGSGAAVHGLCLLRVAPRGDR